MKWLASACSWLRRDRSHEDAMLQIAAAEARRADNIARLRALEVRREMMTGRRLRQRGEPQR